jgi:signal transduction histidine kinase
MAVEIERPDGEVPSEIDRAKSAFFANVGHEFRTLLMLLLGPIEEELAERDPPLPPGRHARLQVAHRNGLRLLRMVDTLLDFSPVEAGRMQGAGAYVKDALRGSAPSDGASDVRSLDIGELGAPEVAPSTRSRVLLADANADMRSYLGRLLRHGYEVEDAADGDAVLAAAGAHPPDLIVLDVTLSGRDSLDVLKALRTTPSTCSIPVVLTSARSGEDAALEGLDAGADDYLVKPFSGKTLLARVRSCLALAKQRKESSDRLAEANEELEAFSYSVSHDLRAPLRAIDGFSKALLSDYAGALDDQGRHHLERVRSGTQRMGQLIDDLLSLSRIARAPLAREHVDVTALARRVLADLAGRDAERAVEWSVAEGLHGRGDNRLVPVVLENLLGNAWKFSSKVASPRIEVGSETREGETVFFVRDNGAGFDMAYANKLFAPFQRLHSAKEFQGTGIGLATVQRVITRHGGRIHAESAPGQGATFFFTLGDPA